MLNFSGITWQLYTAPIHVMWYVNSGSQNSVVKTMTCFRVNSPGGGGIFHAHSEHPQGPPSLLYNGYGSLLGEWLGCGAEHPLPSSTKSCTSTSICANIGISWGDFYLYLYIKSNSCTICVFVNIIGKAIPLQAWTGPEGSRSLRLPDFKTIGTWRW